MWVSLLTLVVIAGCTFVAWQAYREITRMTIPHRDNLLVAEARFNQMATAVPPMVRALNDSVQMYIVTGNPLYLDRLQNQRHELADWIEERRSVWTGSALFRVLPGTAALQLSARPLLDDLHRQFEVFSGAVTNLNGPHHERSAEQATLAGLRMLELASEAGSQAKAIEMLMEFARKWSLTYWTLIGVSLGALVALTAWLATVLYRLIIVPMRMQLVENTAILEQQKKLAHFGELAAGLAHEIRNPLTAINTRLYTLQRSLASNTPAAEDAGVIANELARLDRVVKDFLKLARPAPPQFDTLTAPALFEQTAQLMASNLTQRGIALVIGETVNTPFRADPQLLKQVLINLIQNAADAIAAQGMITLSARFALQKLHGKQREVVVLEVTDDGPGIPPEVQGRLFDPFFSTKEHGTGLGLSLSANIVAQHNGALEFQTAPGRGTTFGIVLPAGGTT